VSAELLPCPFCGSGGEVEVYDNRGTFVQCCGCFARAESVDAWNNRAHAAEQAAQEPSAECWRRAATERFGNLAASLIEQRARELQEAK